MSQNSSVPKHNEPARPLTVCLCRHGYRYTQQTITHYTSEHVTIKYKLYTRCRITSTLQDSTQYCPVIVDHFAQDKYRNRGFLFIVLLFIYCLVNKFLISSVFTYFSPFKCLGINQWFNKLCAKRQYFKSQTI